MVETWRDIRTEQSRRQEAQLSVEQYQSNTGRKAVTCPVNLFLDWLLLSMPISYSSLLSIYCYIYLFNSPLAYFTRDVTMQGHFDFWRFLFGLSIHPENFLWLIFPHCFIWLKHLSEEQETSDVCRWNVQLLGKEYIYLVTHAWVNGASLKWEV